MVAVSVGDQPAEGGLLQVLVQPLEGGLASHLPDLVLRHGDPERLMHKRRRKGARDRRREGAAIRDDAVAHARPEL